MDHAHDLLEGILVSFEQVGDDNCNAPAYSSHAVDEDIGLFSCFFNELISLAKMLTEVIGCMIFSWDIEIMLNLLSFMFE